MSCLRLVELRRPGGHLDATPYMATARPRNSFLAQRVQAGRILQESAAFRCLSKPESRDVVRQGRLRRSWQNADVLGLDGVRRPSKGRMGAPEGRGRPRRGSADEAGEAKDV